MTTRKPLDYDLNNPIIKDKDFRYFPDKILIISIIFLVAFGLAVLYSASGQSWSMVSRQATYSIIGLVLMLLIAQLNPSSYKNILIQSYWLNLLLLVLVLFFPDKSHNTDRWIDLGFMSFQPSEIVRLLLPISICAFLSRKEALPKLSDWLISTIAVIICSLLIFQQPDLGTAIIVFFSGFIVIYLSGLPLYLLFIYVISTVAVSPFVWMSLSGYMKQRIYTFINPENDPLGSGWNIAQSKAAIGSGGLTGKGYLQGTQNQLNFIPEDHSDFIFSVIGEELGLVGIAFLFILYSIILYRSIKIGLEANSKFEKVACLSLSIIFIIIILINVLMVIGIIPTVGVPLPLVSQGGTSLIVHLLAFGLILSMRKKTQW